MTKSLFTLAIGISFIAPVLAQELAPLEEAQRGARKVTDVLGTPTDAPFSITVDVTKPQAIKSGPVGLLVIPDKQLTSATLAGLGPNITPIGQLWTLNVSLGKEGEPVPNDQLRFLSVNDGERDLQVQLYYLGATKGADGKMDLVIYGKGKEPLLKLPIIDAKTAGTQLFPIEISGHKDDDKTGTLSLKLTGNYSTDLTVKRPAE
jgi:hypothetical protein